MLERRILAWFRRHPDLAPIFAVAMGLFGVMRSSVIGPPAVGVALAGLGLVVVLVGALISPRAGLFGVVMTLPFFLFPRELGSQSVSASEAALLVTALAVGLRAFNGRYRLVYARPPGDLTPGPSPARRGEAEKLLPLSAPTWGIAAEGPHSSWKRGLGGEVGFAAFDGPVALLLASALLSLLATEYLRLSLRELRTLIVEPIMFWYLCRAVLRSPRDVAWLIGAFVGVSTVVAVIGLGQLALGGAVTDVQGVRRVLGAYTSPNHFALLLGRALPFLVAIGWCVPSWRLWAAAGGVLCAGALLATFSVGGWLGTGTAMLVVVGLLGGRRILLGLVLAGAVALAIVLFAVPVERLAGRLDPRQGTSFVRIQLWQAAVELVGQSPLLGIGLDNFLYRYPTVMPLGTTYEPNLSHPHNLVLQFWLQLGLPGLVALGWLLARFAGLTWPAARDATGPPLERALAAGALGSMTDFVAHGLVDNSYFLPDMAIVFWLTLAVAASMARPPRHAGV